MLLVIPVIGDSNCRYTAGACPGCLKGGGPISLGSLKKGHQILKRGGQMV